MIESIQALWRKLGAFAFDHGKRINMLEGKCECLQIDKSALECVVRRLERQLVRLETELQKLAGLAMRVDQLDNSYTEIVDDQVTELLDTQQYLVEQQKLLREWADGVHMYLKRDDAFACAAVGEVHDTEDHGDESL